MLTYLKFSITLLSIAFILMAFAVILHFN